MQILTNEEIKNILVLIGLAPIKGEQAITVALLQQKLKSMVTPDVTTPTTASNNENTTA